MKCGQGSLKAQGERPKAVFLNLWVTTHLGLRDPFIRVVYQLSCISSIYNTIFNSSKISYEAAMK